MRLASKEIEPDKQRNIRLARKEIGKKWDLAGKEIGPG
jgi:hypothetical protein